MYGLPFAVGRFAVINTSIDHHRLMMIGRFINAFAIVLVQMRVR